MSASRQKRSFHNIEELAPTAFVVLLVVAPSLCTIGYKEEQSSGGESVSQSPLKDNAFWTFLDQNPPFQLPPENGIPPSTKAYPAQWPVIDTTATRLASRIRRSPKNAPLLRWKRRCGMAHPAHIAN
jgi:hypothetical protein